MPQLLHVCCKRGNLLRLHVYSMATVQMIVLLGVALKDGVRFCDICGFIGSMNTGD